MIQVSIPPELSYALWVAVFLMMFLMFACYAIQAYERAKKEQSGWMVLWIFFCVVGIINVLAATDKVRAWYDIVAQLHGW